MTSNPLDTVGGNGLAGPMKVGETKTITVRAKDGEIIKTYTLTRTSRPYVHDLCDAYSDALTDHTLRWVVTPGGELKLTHDLDWSLDSLRRDKAAKETERQHFNANRPNRATAA